LAGHGFTEVCLEDLSFLEQVKLFSSASHVVAAHGSGLTNVLFAKDLKVIELFSEGHGVRPEYFQLSTVLGHQYRAVVSHSVNDANDFRVDVNVVLNLLAISSACP
jgi:capsular polysaccharide biosynthesis protein